MPEGIYGERTPAEVVVYPTSPRCTASFLDNALRAEKEGYDVFALGSVQDPVIEEARSLLDIPVVGYGESAMHFACLLGSRFVIIAFGERFDQMLDERVKRLGLAERALPTMLMDRTTFADVGKGWTMPPPSSSPSPHGKKSHRAGRRGDHPRPALLERGDRARRRDAHRRGADRRRARGDGEDGRGHGGSEEARHLGHPPRLYCMRDRRKTCSSRRAIPQRS